VSCYAPVSALATAQEISAGRLTAQAALDHCAQRVEIHEQHVQAFQQVLINWDPQEGPLGGIAVGIKDVFDTYDMPTTYGSAIYETHQPTIDSTLATLLRKCGATIAGKTVTTEFAWFTPGKTRNPHNLEHTPGGSSSGSAAGVAAGFFPAAIGTQTGGSIIRPAAFCGVSGYKPSFRLFPTLGLKHFSWSLDTIGFFAAKAEDNAFIASTCSKRDLHVSNTDGSPPKFGILKSPIDDLMSAEMANAIEQLRSQAQTKGASVIEVQSPPAVEEAREAHAIIQGYEAVLALAHESRTTPNLFSKELAEYLTESGEITAQQYDDARRTANHARKASRQLFEDCDVLLLPSAPSSAPATLASTGDSVFNRLWTLLGMPCVNVLAGFDQKGLPLGVQIIAPFGQDKKALQAAHWLENVISTS
jgi:Asp-tRNA(Asn)/Glu-tRNA(Gln) amidotransferase A subunit family amidase